MEVRESLATYTVIFMSVLARLIRTAILLSGEESVCLMAPIRQVQE